jgi:hypothetical protein
MFEVIQVQEFFIGSKNYEMNVLRLTYLQSYLLPSSRQQYLIDDNSSAYILCMGREEEKDMVREKL